MIHTFGSSRQQLLSHGWLVGMIALAVVGVFAWPDPSHRPPGLVSLAVVASVGLLVGTLWQHFSRAVVVAGGEVFLLDGWRPVERQALGELVGIGFGDGFVLDFGETVWELGCDLRHAGGLAQRLADLAQVPIECDHTAIRRLRQRLGRQELGLPATIDLAGWPPVEPLAMLASTAVAGFCAASPAVLAVELVAVGWWQSNLRDGASLASSSRLTVTCGPGGLRWPATTIGPGAEVPWEKVFACWRVGDEWRLHTPLGQVVLAPGDAEVAALFEPEALS